MLYSNEYKLKKINRAGDVLGQQCNKEGQDVNRKRNINFAVVTYSSADLIIVGCFIWRSPNSSDIMQFNKRRD